ncbi:MAG: type II secretion system protein [Candidatus Aminicenantales bacterium]
MVRRSEAGYTLLILMVFISVLTVAFLIAMPILETQSRREREDELQFRGRQYVEAIRLFVRKNPGGFPKSIEDLVKKRFLRKAYADPMTKSGTWNIILMPGLEDFTAESPLSQPGDQDEEGPPQEASDGGTTAVTKVMLVPEKLLSSVDNPRIIGVVSTSKQKSFYIYDENETYDTWLFYLGREKGAKPEIIHFGAPTK